MVFEKGKPRPPLKVKTCVICRRSFQPLSGAQKLCGEPACKARSRMEKYLEKKASKNGDHEGDRGEERLAGIDRENSIPEKKKTYSLDESHVPELEIDLTPLAHYIKAMIADALQHTQSPQGNDEDLRELVRELVREEISARLKPLFGNA